MIIPSLVSPGKDNANQFNEDTFVIEKETKFYNDPTYRLRSLKYDNQYLSIIGNRVEFVPAVADESKSTEQQNEYNLVRRSSFNVYLKYIEQDQVGLMFELAARPGRFISVPSNVGKPEMQDLTRENFALSLFNTSSMDLSKLNYALPFSGQGVKFSFMEANGTKYLRHMYDRVWVEQMETKPKAMSKYDSSWYVEPTTKPSTFTFRSVNFPHSYMAYNESKGEVVLSKKEECHEWVLKPMQDSPGVYLQWVNQTDVYLSFNPVDRTAVLTEKPFGFLMLPAVSPALPIPLPSFSLESIIDLKVCIFFSCCSRSFY